MSYLSDLLGSAYHEGMTEDELSTALEGVVKATDDDTLKLKNAISRANKEAAEYKKQLLAKMSETEKAEAERKEKEAALIEENNQLKHTIQLSETTGKLLAQGYNADLATKAANAILSGDVASVLECQTAFLADQKKKMEAKAMDETPKPKTTTQATAGTDYSKLIDNARATGDLSAVAYYTRLSQQDNNNIQ